MCEQLYLRVCYRWLLLVTVVSLVDRSVKLYIIIIIIKIHVSLDYYTLLQNYIYYICKKNNRTLYIIYNTLYKIHNTLYKIGIYNVHV